ncbi:MAG TPA: NYN domain-containing protein [Chthonomonadaceae bacterium]|nr:NYN domain-containing protein [Chthonomonadaceae bacterium]
MNSCVILVDNTNLFIGGQQLAASRHHRHHHSRHQEEADRSWRLDFKGLYACLARGRQVYKAVMVGSSEPDTHPGWDQAARDAGFEVILHDTNGHHQEKAVDTELVARGTEIICSAPQPMTLVLASGDRDYVPLVDVAHRQGWNVELCAFTDSYPRDGELANAVDRVHPLDSCLPQITL